MSEMWGWCPRAERWGGAPRERHGAGCREPTRSEVALARSKSQSVASRTGWFERVTHLGVTTPGADTPVVLGVG